MGVEGVYYVYKEEQEMKKTTVSVKKKYKKPAMTADELREYYAHGRGYTRVADTTKAYRENKKAKRDLDFDI